MVEKIILKIITIQIKFITFLGKKFFNTPTILNNEDYIEIMVSDILGYKWNHGQGSDAFNLKNEGVEFKSINIASKSSGEGGKPYGFSTMNRSSFNKYMKNEEFWMVLRDGIKIISLHKISKKYLIKDINRWADEHGGWDYLEKNNKSYTITRSKAPKISEKNIIINYI